ncbi:MAG TPA: hypothetical protein VJB14_07575 [Planctomycetota bacterium]|nr:hypothetical protein [Planctomycetota bacterium]
MSTRPGFYGRQFLLPPSRAQTVWDLLFGILLPLGCLAGDRLLFGRSAIVAPGRLFEGSIFGGAAPAAYTFILTEVGLLALWILLRRKVTGSAAFFAGPLLAGWGFSLVLAIGLLPLSLVGLIVVIGVLGFSPWLTCFAFYRNWKMARLLCADHVSRTRRLLLSLAGIVFAVTPALAVTLA